ncbi:RnlA-like RNase toxin of RnlAB toxin-antitoxin system [Cytobacillus oceanisediminis]|uniref:RnlA-like RNase toxin of RnlAB toxin-antitoxin system n=1 Tax=Cytobacillus oceanisediminis TaxID=665099 RepID=A0A2V2ZRK4_9BACI|nr:type II toxin-antitoxin system RnlA family toxin [Cytobacillus oceanisediminis]PWW26627.1 RnlA-like RNase toxin of RnlAB toxin-antitoxin system [Cytobacillus oceanisediminis]
MSKNIFKALNLDREKLPVIINEFAQKRFSSCEVSDIEHINGTLHRCTIQADYKTILLDLYYLENGKTTLRPSGQHMDISTELAAHIKGNIQFAATDRTGDYSVCPLEEEEFDFIIAFLEEGLEGVKKITESHHEEQKYVLYQFQSSIADKITLKYYKTTSRLQIQGKPMYLYQEVTCLLAKDFQKFDEVIKNQSEFFSIEIKPEEIREEMQELLPSAYNYLGENQRKILSVSLALQKIDIPLEDYSSFVFPALKTLEGFMKQILTSNGIRLSKKETIGDLFGYNGITARHVYLSKEGKELKDGVTKTWMETLYNYYVKERHSLFHVEDMDVFTRIIESKQEADRIISKIIDMMEKAHEELSKVSLPS